MVDRPGREVRLRPDAVVEGVALDRYAARLFDQIDEALARHLLRRDRPGLVEDLLGDHRAVEIVGTEMQPRLGDARGIMIRKP
jgi:hypothetical protein